MFLKILRGIIHYRDPLLDWTEMVACFVILLFNLFSGFWGIHDLNAVINAVLIVLGLLALGRRLDHQTNHAIQQASEETLHGLQTLMARQIQAQQTLTTIDTRMQTLDLNQADLAQSLGVISGSMKSLVENQWYPNQDGAFECLLKYISRHPVSKATFLQYSGKYSEPVLSALVLQKHAQATVYIQHEELPEQLKSARQVDRITSTIRNSLSDLSRKLPDPSKLAIYKFKTPASVRAIRLDEQVLCIGWYTYERVDRQGWLTFPDDQTAISGHDRPMLVVWKGTEEYEFLNGMVTEMVENYQQHAEVVAL